MVMQRLDLGFIHGGPGGVCFPEDGAIRPPPGLAAYTANAIHFDGTNDWLNRGADLSSNADGKAGIFSCWVRLTGAGAANQSIFLSRDAQIGWQIAWATATSTFNIAGRNSANTTILSMLSASTYTSADGWIHILASWNLAAGYGAYYINDASDLAGSPTLTNDTIDYTRTEHTVGATTGGTSKLEGDLADLYVNYATSLDLSVEANRRKFISATGKPVSLGADGSTPTGSQPIVFLANPTATWQNNLGSGGNFTENGALTDAASSPSD